MSAQRLQMDSRGNAYDNNNNNSNAIQKTKQNMSVVRNRHTASA